ncbi:SGT1 protein-domain-containing protein [Flammula alnicola]|nr:SGT1 protein-domain-containing protein [Flammula alnicola]
MDIFNRPHSIAEDTLHYTIHPPSNLSDKTSATSFAACITTYVDSMLGDFIWHRDAFEVKIVPNPDDEKSWILEGRMRVGDCVDDEWFTVWLLKEISSKWDIVISVYDSDGEFLLIEAAEALPLWVKPTNSENRVWIYNSHLHLIPLSHISPTSRKRRHRKLPGAADSDDEDGTAGDDDTFIAVEDAVKFVRDSSLDTLAPPDVEKIIWQRIAGYPAAAKNHVHVTKAYIPIDVARTLTVNPSLVQKAVETFYTRDAIQLRGTPHDSFSTQFVCPELVKMTRTAYAQLIGQKFFPPKIFGNWKEKEGSNEWRWRDVGMKISSELWNKLENKQLPRSWSDATRPSFASQVDAAIASVKNSPDFLNREEDSDDWLNVDAQEFEQMLEATRGQPKKDRLASEQAKKLKDLASKVENFIEGEGDLEGARFEDENFSDEPFSDDEESSESDSEAEPQSAEAKQAEKRAAMDRLVPALEPTDYGKMPPTYHSNSQRVAPQTMATDAVVGEIEIDMDEEQEEFLEFSRQALGITDELWSKIVEDRKDRGAFLPSSATKPSPFSKGPSDNAEKPAPRTHTPRVPEPGPRPNVNPDLDSFEAVMKALDEALSKANKPSQKSTAQKPPEQKPPAELKEALEDPDWEGEEPPDYNMIKNFLESYKSQAGLSGPVSNLAGRLQPDFKLPRDDF